MITATDLVKDEASLKEELKDSSFRLAKVVELFKNQTAKIQFDGEEEPSEKEYSYLTSYIPAVGDRVILGAISNTYIIFGSVRFNVEPDVEEEIDRYLFDEKKVTVKKGIDITGGLKSDTGEIETISGKKADYSNIKGETIEVSGKADVGSLVSSGAIEGKAISGTSVTSGGSVRGYTVSATTEVSGLSIKASNQVSGASGNFNTTNAGNLSCSQMSTTGNITGTGYNQFARVNVTGELKHSGGTIGFLGKSPVGARTVPQASGDLNSVTSTVNQLRQALRDFGLLR